jgi:FkbM family methyltransferase
VKAGDHVIEIGGHIGYITMYFSELVREAGLVTVFEPGPNNLPYLRRNARELKSVRIIEEAVCDQVGQTTFYVENYTGQNNSLVEGSFDNYLKNCKVVGLVGAAPCPYEVKCTTLDAFLEKNGRDPQLVKIDVEGAECLVLQGMEGILRAKNPVLAVEVTRENTAVFSMLRRFGYRFFSPEKTEIQDVRHFKDNVFAVKGDDPRLQIFLPKK